MCSSNGSDGWPGEGPPKSRVPPGWKSPSRQIGSVRFDVGAPAREPARPGAEAGLGELTLRGGYQDRIGREAIMWRVEIGAAGKQPGAGPRAAAVQRLG